MQLDSAHTDRLIELGRALIDQQAARIIVPPNEAASGFWFGGGNMVQDEDGAFWLVGRYRNAGDSRLGVAAGTRGLELAIFRSTDRAKSFEKIVSLSKQDVSHGEQQVLSIEGAALSIRDGAAELFVSTEKSGLSYPSGFEAFLKPGAGVWTVDRVSADSVESLPQADVEACLASSDPEYLHIKDPFVATDKNGELTLWFCSHPFSWSSSNTGLVTRSTDGRFGDPIHDLFPRGTTWDVAMTRGTAVVDVPRLGCFESVDARLLFYDGGECLRNLDEHAAAVTRPRGYSCEELGGLAWMPGGGWTTPRRLSRYEPLFVSPYGTGCSRYVDVLTTDEGMYATWQQAQADGSQPLVLNFLPATDIERILSSGTA